MALLRTRFVAIDSATLNKLARDLLGTDAHLRGHAASVLDSIQADNWIPVITLHHLSEMVQHADPALAVERLRFLRRFPLLAYVKPMDGQRFPATIVQIAAREVRAVISGCRTLNDVITEVRADLFGVASGEELIPIHPDFVDMLRGQAIPQHVEDNIIASIVRSDAGNVRHVKLIDSLATAIAVVPSLWHLEVGNALLVGERKKRCSQADTVSWLGFLASLPIVVDEETALRAWSDVLNLARTHDLSAYDAAYLELALRRGLPLASLDTKLNAAAAAAGVPMYTS